MSISRSGAVGGGSGSGGTQVSVDGAPVATLELDSAAPTPADIGAQPAATTLTALAARGPVSVTYAATITPDPTIADVLTIGALTGNLTLAAPVAGSRDGQSLRIRFAQDATGSRTITWNAAYAFGTDVTTAAIPTAASAKWEMLFVWHAGDSKWRALSIARGF